VGEKKYDASAAAMIGLLKFDSGVPFCRLAGLEASLGIPLPPATQWEIVEEMAEVIRPALGTPFWCGQGGSYWYRSPQAHP
jgi:hypothetical protein